MSVLRKLALFVLLALAANTATVASLPWLINTYVLHKVERLAGGANRALPAPRADATARAIVRPSPDLLYTACVFDLSEGPLHITAPVQDGYVSVAGFASDTDNFFAINDAEVGPAKRFDIVIARAGFPVDAPGAQLVVAPSDRGLILFRSLITNEAELPRLREFQAQQVCQPL